MHHCTPEEIYRKRASMPGFCRFEEISGNFILFTVMLEDTTFIHHKGFCLRSIQYAASSFLQKGYACGGSTITQQLVKNLYFSFEPRISRKLLEFILTIWFERKLSKKQILELYLNCIYYDNGQYGISDASRFYFGKSPKKLTPNQAFFLAALLPVVGACNPLYRPKEFFTYRAKKLDRLSSSFDEIKEEILKYGPDFPDEEFCARASTLTDPYNGPGPMKNEQYGPDGTSSLIR